MVFAFEATPEGSRVTATTFFDSVAGLERMLAMGMEQGMTTETMIGTEGPSSTNELTLTAVEGGTVPSILVTYPDADVRDSVLATGMTDGMETSYARLELLIG